MERNFETVMIEQCAPVLAGLKPAGLFRYETRDCADLARRVRSWNEQLASKGLSVRVLKGCVRTHQFLIYVYREARLRAIFADEAVRVFLAREGYQLPQEQEQTGIMLTQLSRRLCCSAEFPHEIGVFLGYPLKSVKAAYPAKRRLASPNVFRSGATCIDEWKIYTSSMLTVAEKLVKDMIHDPAVTRYDSMANGDVADWHRAGVASGRFPTISPKLLEAPQRPPLPVRRAVPGTGTPPPLPRRS